MITPLEIQNKEFKKGIRGYKEDQVDEFLDQIMIDYEKLYKENIELKDKLESTNGQLNKYENIEETLKNTLIIAQNAAEDTKSNARKESELIIQDANVKSKEIINKAHKQVESIKDEYEETKKQMQIFKIRFKTLLQSQLEAVLHTCTEVESQEDEEIN